ncbi:MAG: VOC family protein, partial [Kocuria sp.]|nr:VOC family protein [Kocuria sp.]
MKLDHVSFAAQSDGLEATTERIADQLGIEPVKGGIHPRFGTRNMILPLTGHQYVEVVEVLEHPAADKAPFGQAVRARSEAGGGWLGWVVEVQDLTPYEDKLGRPSVPGFRLFPDGRQLEWRQIGVKGLIADPQLPFMVRFESEPEMHPSQARITDVQLAGMDIAGS